MTDNQAKAHVASLFTNNQFWPHTPLPKSYQQPNRWEVTNRYSAKSYADFEAQASFKIQQSELWSYETGTLPPDNTPFSVILLDFDLERVPKSLVDHDIGVCQIEDLEVVLVLDSSGNPIHVSA